MRRALIMTLALLGLPSIAPAAEPSSGTVSASSPKATWTGTLTQAYAGGYVPFFLSDGAASTPCQAPSCDRFELTVADGPADLLVTVTQGQSVDGGFETLRVIRPDGEVVYQYDASTGDSPLKMRIKNAANGVYTVDVTSGNKTQVSYEAVAELSVPPPVPAAAAPPEPVRLTLAAPKSASARKLARSRRLGVRVTTSREVVNVTGTLSKGKSVVARGRLGRLSGTGTLVLKLSKRRLKAGAYELSVAATGADGQSVQQTAKVKLRR